MTKLVEIMDALHAWAVRHGVDGDDMGVTISFETRRLRDLARASFFAETKPWEIMNYEEGYPPESFRVNGISTKFSQLEL